MTQRATHGRASWLRGALLMRCTRAEETGLVTSHASPLFSRASPLATRPAVASALNTSGAIGAAISQRCRHESESEANCGTSAPRSFGGVENRTRSLSNAAAVGAPPAPGPDTHS